MLCGFFFNIWIGMLIILIGGTIGSLISFLIAKYLFKNFIKNKFLNKYSLIKDHFNKNGLKKYNYLPVT